MCNSALVQVTSEQGKSDQNSWTVRLEKSFSSYKQPILIQQKSYFRLGPKRRKQMKSFWVAIRLGNSSVTSVVCILAILSVWKRGESFRVVHSVGFLEGLTSTPHLIHLRQCLMLFCEPQSKSYKSQGHRIWGGMVIGASFCWRW